MKTGEAKLSAADVADYAPKAKTAVVGPGKYHIAFANVDDELLLWVDGRLISFEGGTAYDVTKVFGDRRSIRPQTSGEDLGDLARSASGLNPVQKVGEQIAETPRRVLGQSRGQARAQALELLHHVGIPDPEQRYDSYPYELSGGTRQRIMIAIALASQASVLLCDEPTTALDVTIQAQILRLLVDLQREMGLSVVFVTHELALVGQLCQDVCVMYAGRLVETGPTAAVLAKPLHPYTLGLLRSAVDLDEELEPPKPIPGSLPDPARRPGGCPFHPRCFLATAECATTTVDLIRVDATRASACLHVDQLVTGDGRAMLREASRGDGDG